VKLLLDELYSNVVADRLQARGHDVVSVLDQDYDYLRGAPDEQVFAAATATQRVLVTENVSDFRRLEDEALASGAEHPGLIYTTNRQFPRGDPAAVGRLVRALDRLLAGEPALSTAIFLRPDSP
jgi:predicted nuclease of predicted toxin-antitoxin system